MKLIKMDLAVLTRNTDTRYVNFKSIEFNPQIILFIEGFRDMCNNIKQTIICTNNSDISFLYNRPRETIVRFSVTKFYLKEDCRKINGYNTPLYEAINS